MADVTAAGRSRRQQKQCEARDDAERRQRLTSLITHDDLRRLVRRVDSEYSRRRLQDSWTRNLQQMYSQAGTPTSHWWTHYMRIVAVRTAHSIIVYPHYISRET